MEDSRHVARLRKVLAIVLASLAVFLPLDIAAYFAFGDERSLYMGLVTGAIGVVWYWSRRELKHGHLDTAVMMTCFSFVVPTLLLVFIRPYLYPVLAIGPIVAVAVTLPLARGRVLAILTVAAACSSLAIVGIGSHLNGRVPNELPPEVAGPIFNAALAIVLGLVLLSLWQFGGRLAEAMAESHSTLAALRTSNDQLKRVDSFKTQFMNTAAHEINTPLTPIRLQLHLLRTGGIGQVDEATRRALNIVDRNVERVAGLVRDVLDASRIQGGRLALRLSPVDMRDIVREVSESFRDPARVTGVELVAEVAQPLPTIGDARRLNQVLFNFVGNALKFTPHGGKITIHADLVDDEIQIRVTDTGAGFKPEDAAKLFRPFSQLETGSALRGGTGLGLFISRGIVTEHGGRVGASSPGPGKGSLFWFAIPVKTATIQSEPAKVRLDPAEVRIRELI
ncbi:MAG: HAMP domain-containing histidine kinase [Euryarchaeota archaeon]|nr:HAMP domain-containing histidine kinase [Euryarchaeota archaeon]